MYLRPPVRRPLGVISPFLHDRYGSAVSSKKRSHLHIHPQGAELELAYQCRLHSIFCPTCDLLCLGLSDMVEIDITILILYKLYMNIYHNMAQLCKMYLSIFSMQAQRQSSKQGALSLIYSNTDMDTNSMVDSGHAQVSVHTNLEVCV